MGHQHDHHRGGDGVSVLDEPTIWIGIIVGSSFIGLGLVALICILNWRQYRQVERPIKDKLWSEIIKK